MYDQVASNKRRSLALTAIFVLLTTVVVATILYLFDFGFVGVLIAVVVSVGSAWASYWKSDVIALKMSRAVEADRTTYARLHNSTTPEQRARAAARLAAYARDARELAAQR